VAQFLPRGLIYEIRMVLPGEAPIDIAALLVQDHASRHAKGLFTNFFSPVRAHLFDDARKAQQVDYKRP
jgi:hypothetical protein